MTAWYSCLLKRHQSGSTISGTDLPLLRASRRITRLFSHFSTTSEITFVEVRVGYGTGFSATSRIWSNGHLKSPLSHLSFEVQKGWEKTRLSNVWAHFLVDTFCSLRTDVILLVISTVTWKTVCSLLWMKLFGRAINRPKG